MCLARAVAPVALVTLELPVVRGFRVTLSAPLNSPPPFWGGQLWVVLAVAEFPVVELVEQAPPAFGPAVQPVAPVPLQGGVPQLYFGQGAASLAASVPPS